jgi:hypothetical protein
MSEILDPSTVFSDHNETYRLSFVYGCGQFHAKDAGKSSKCALIIYQNGFFAAGERMPGYTETR